MKAMRVRFTAPSFGDFEYWQKHDPKKIERIRKLCRDIAKRPYRGIGKPEPLKFDLQGYWSRRINRMHRLVYAVDDNGILILSCRYHY